MGHAKLRIGTSSVMLAEEFQGMNAKRPHSIEGSPVGHHSSVKDVDSKAQKAIQAGSENPISSLSDYQRICWETMRSKAADCVSQERGMIRRSSLAKL